jgi:hypothetical protein
MSDRPGSKVVEDFGILFKDDFSIVKSEISRRMNLPKSGLLFPEELLIIYGGSVYGLSEKQTGRDYMKVYTAIYGMQNLGQVKQFEEKYFSDNSQLILALQKEFIENCVDVPADLKPKMPQLGMQVGKELAKRIDEAYAGPVFDFGNIVLLDEKVYDLLTISQHLKNYENSFEPTFLGKLMKASETITPEEFAKMLEQNRDMMREEVFTVVRDKVWCNDRSGKIFLDGKYFVAEYKERKDALVDGYLKQLEKTIKLKAVESFQRGAGP